jgi:lipoate-protein ligase A
VTLWAGRVGSELASEVWDFLRADDLALFPYDCAGTLLHAQRLHVAGILSDEELAEAKDTLERIVPEDVEPGDEDVHSTIERLLGPKIGAGRSRNDQVATALKLYVADACAEAIAAVTGLEPELKFPNDLLVDGRKVAGILAEAREGRVVLGVGINVNVPKSDLPREVDRPATSLLAETGREVDRAELLVELLERLERRYKAWSDQGPRT